MKVLKWVLYFVLAGCAGLLFKYNHTFSDGWRLAAIIANGVVWFAAITILNHILGWRLK